MPFGALKLTIMATQNEYLEDAEKYWKNKEPKLSNPKRYSGVNTEWLAWKDLKNENRDLVKILNQLIAEQSNCVLGVSNETWISALKLLRKIQSK